MSTMTVPLPVAPGERLTKPEQQALDRGIGECDDRGAQRIATPEGLLTTKRVTLKRRPQAAREL